MSRFGLKRAIRYIASRAAFFGRRWHWGLIMKARTFKIVVLALIMGVGTAYADDIIFAPLLASQTPGTFVPQGYGTTSSVSVSYSSNLKVWDGGYGDLAGAVWADTDDAGND